MSHALAFEQIGCEHDAEHECQDCYLWRRAEKWSLARCSLNREPVSRRARKPRSVPFMWNKLWGERETASACFAAGWAIVVLGLLVMLLFPNAFAGWIMIGGIVAVIASLAAMASSRRASS